MFPSVGNGFIEKISQKVKNGKSNKRPDQRNDEGGNNHNLEAECRKV